MSNSTTDVALLGVTSALVGFFVGYTLSEARYVRAAAGVPLVSLTRQGGEAGTDAEPEPTHVNVDGDVSDREMMPYVCAGCGTNYDYTGSAPEKCPHCGGDMIETE